MKLMKKAMKCLVAVFMMAMAFTATGITVSAADAKSFADTNLGSVAQKEISNVGISNDDMNKLGSFSNNYIQQTDATKNSVTISWYTPYSQYAEGYVVYINNAYYAEVADTTITIPNLYEGTAYDLQVYFVNAGSGYYLGEDEASSALIVKTAPAKKTSDRLSVKWKSNDKITVYYIDDLAGINSANMYEKYSDGIEFRVKNVKGSKKKTVKSTLTKQVSVYASQEAFIDEFTFKAPGAIKNKGMQYQFRTYFTLPNGKKIYSDWSSNYAYVPQAKIAKAKQAGSNKIKYTWKKVSGAKSYTIYKTTDGGRTFKKVKKVSAKTTSYTVSGLRANDSNHGVWVRADKVKVGKKRVNSSKSYYTSLEITYR